MVYKFFRAKNGIKIIRKNEHGNIIGHNLGLKLSAPEELFFDKKLHLIRL